MISWMMWRTNRLNLNDSERMWCFKLAWLHHRIHCKKGPIYIKRMCLWLAWCKLHHWNALLKVIPYNLFDRVTLALKRTRARFHRSFCTLRVLWEAKLEICRVCQLKIFQRVLVRMASLSLVSLRIWCYSISVFHMHEVKRNFFSFRWTVKLFWR